ncbi:hypothetical protein GCM10020220_025600 [Nonomuraea rubra]|uniref:lantibiotic dehydratase n=1 Tax=Nonomuraea rubra TaxID=46180 RepID=UPI0031E71FDA
MTQVTHAVPVAGDGDSARLADPDYALSPLLAVRVAGLPVAGLDRMRCTRTWRLVDELADVSARLRREGAGLSDQLHEVIGGVAAGPLKAGLVALRRAVFAGRRPSGRAASAEVLADLPAGLAARLEAWTALRRRAEGLRAELPAVLAAESREKTAVLREAVSDAGFRHGLAQGSAVLAGRLEAWLAGPADRPPERQELLRLARYLARASVKTSPYATFTLSGLGRWEPDGPAVRTGGEPSWQVMAELDRAVLRPLWAVLTRHRCVRERARLRVNPSASDDGNRIWFLSPGHGEPLSSVPASPEVRQALDWVRERHTATVASAPGIEPLAEAGLLEYVPPYDEQGADPVGELASWLAPDSPAPYAQAIARVADALRDHGKAATDVRAAPHDSDKAATDVRAVLRDGDEVAGVVRSALREVLPPGPSLPDKNLLWHSAVMPGVAGRLNASAWRGVCDDLDALRGLLGLFDPDLPVKIAATAFFLDRYGPGGRIPAVELYREIHREAPGAGGALLRAMLRDPVAGTRAPAGRRPTTRPHPPHRTASRLLGTTRRRPRHPAHRPRHSQRGLQHRQRGPRSPGAGGSHGGPPEGAGAGVAELRPAAGVDLLLPPGCTGPRRRRARGRQLDLRRVRARPVAAAPPGHPGRRRRAVRRRPAGRAGRGHGGRVPRPRRRRPERPPRHRRPRPRPPLHRPRLEPPHRRPG